MFQCSQVTFKFYNKQLAGSRVHQERRRVRQQSLRKCFGEMLKLHASLIIGGGLHQENFRHDLATLALDHQGRVAGPGS